jgi:hypothetical protein
MRGGCRGAASTAVATEQGMTCLAEADREKRAGDVVLQLKSAFKDGTTPIVMAPLQFMQRLAAWYPARAYI